MHGWTWKEHLKEAKKDPFGALWVENRELHNEASKEFDTNISIFTVWLTGLGLGELVFVLSNLNNFFAEKSVLFIITICSLLISVFSGLIYHFTRMILLFRRKLFYEAIDNLSYLRYSKDIIEKEDKKSQEFSKKLEEKYHKQAKIPLPKKWIFNIIWKINAIAFFIASFCLTILLGIKILATTIPSR